MVKETNKLNLEKKLKSYIDSIIKSFNVDQMILFGSYSKGSFHEFSDIDLAVVSPELDPNKSRLENTLKVLEKTNLIDPDLQLFAYPSSVFYNEKNTVHESFIQEIKQTGKTIYSNNKN